MEGLTIFKVLASCWIFLAGGMCLVATGDEGTSPPQSKTDHQIQKLIGGFDSPRFHVREASTKELIALGSDAIPQLARSARNASPESLRRIKMCLEEIGVSSGEENFFKSMALVRVLFDESRSKLNEFYNSWSDRRSENAISTLKSLGARIDVISAQGPLFNNGLVIQMNPQRAASAFRPEATIQKKNVRLVGAALDREIDQILADGVAANRRRLKLAEEPTVEDSESRRLNNLAQILRAQGAINGFPGVSMAGVTVTLGKQWNGELNDLGAIRHIKDLNTVRIEGLRIKDKLLAMIPSNRGIASLEFKNCVFELASGMATLPQVASLEFEKTKVDMTLIKKLDEGITRNLTFNQCVFSRGAMSRIANIKNVRTLQLEGLNLSQKMFQVLAERSELSFLALKGCKFAMADYKELLSVRTDLEIRLLPAAFLGVQSDLGSGAKIGCVITSVVSNSAADEAGIEMGDRITKLDGDKIARFEDLKLKISQYLPGEKIKLEVERRGRRLALDVRLRDWDNAPRF